MSITSKAKALLFKKSNDGPTPERSSLPKQIGKAMHNIKNAASEMVQANRINNTLQRRKAIARAEKRRIHSVFVPRKNKDGVHVMSDGTAYFPDPKLGYGWRRLN